MTEQDHSPAREGVARVTKALDAYLPWWREQPESARLILQNMAFQLGIVGLQAFKPFLAALEDQRYAGAEKELRRHYGEHITILH